MTKYLVAVVVLFGVLLGVVTWDYIHLKNSSYDKGYAAGKKETADSNVERVNRAIEDAYVSGCEGATRETLAALGYDVTTLSSRITESCSGHQAVPYYNF